MRVVVIGGGISGVFIAYELLNRGVRDITIVDSSYPGCGATFRNMGCFRSSFTSVEHVILMKKSIEEWIKLSRKLGFKLKQNGYLWVARRDETVETFKKLASFHNQYGVPSRVLEPSEVKSVEPKLNINIISGAMFDPTAGRMDILEVFTKLYLELRKRGVKFLNYTKAEKLISDSEKIRSVKTSRGILEADVFIVAAAEGSREILSSIGVRLPIDPMPRHPIVTEPYSEVIKPALIIDWDTPGSPHITQTEHGSLILARDIADSPGLPLNSHRFDAFHLVIKPLYELLPFLSLVNIERYWMGYYDMTPDHHPIYGPVEPYSNLYVATGFSGHGMMMAPATGIIIADWVLEGKPRISIANSLTLTRFREGKLVKELAVVG
ncbi:MAG: FAD-binding oxidoreductase [Desulfurococcaceae archaeon]